MRAKSVTDGLAMIVQLFLAQQGWGVVTPPINC